MIFNTVKPIKNENSAITIKTNTSFGYYGSSKNVTVVNEKGLSDELNDKLNGSDNVDDTTKPDNKQKKQPQTQESDKPDDKQVEQPQTQESDNNDNDDTGLSDELDNKLENTKVADKQNNQSQAQEPNVTPAISNDNDTKNQVSGNSSTNNEPVKTEVDIKKDKIRKKLLFDKFVNMRDAINKLSLKMSIFRNRNDINIERNAQAFKYIVTKVDNMKTNIDMVILHRYGMMDNGKLMLLYNSMTTQFLILSEMFLSLFVSDDVKKEISTIRKIRKNLKSS